MDAGRPQTDASFREHVPPFGLPYRGQAEEPIRRTRPTQKDCYACTEHNYDWFCNDLEEPYTTPEGKPFSWQGRMRITGGRTNVWGRQSYRLSDLDFKAASYDGFGEDWPLSYDDLAPYYDLVEEYVGITGSAEGVYELPDGRFQPPMGMTCAETALRDRVKRKLGLDGDHRPQRQPHATARRPRGLPLLRPLRAGLRDPLLLQLGLHHRRRCLEDGPVHPRPERDGLQGAHGRPGPNRATGLLYVDRVTREPQEVTRARRGALRPGPGVGPHPAELREPAEPRRARQLQRRPRATT